MEAGSKNKKTVYTLLIIIMLLATLLRFWTADFGLPHLFYIDETKIVKRAKLIAGNIIHKRWNIDPQFYQYPTFLTNLLAAEYVVYAIGYGIVTTKTGRHRNMQEAIDILFRPSNPAYVYDPYPPIFYLLARLNNAVAGIATVLLCFFLSKLAFDNDDRIALLSAFFLSVMFLHTKHSKYPMADSIMAFWTAAAMIYLVKMLLRGDKKDYILSGLFIGLGTSTKYLTIFLTASYMLNALLRWRQTRNDKAQGNKAWVYAMLGLGMIPIGFLIGTPTFLTRFRQYTKSVIGERKGMGSAVEGGKYGNTQAGFFDYFYATTPSWFEPYTINSLWGAMGIPLLIVTSLAFIYFIYKGINKDTKNKAVYWDFLIFISLIYWFLAGKGKNRIVRYFVIVAPFLTILTGKFLTDMADRIPCAWVKAKKGILLGGVAILLAFPTAIRSVRYNYLMSHTNNRVIAGRWIESNLPRGSKIWMPILYPPCVSSAMFDIHFYRGQQKTADMVAPYYYLKKQGFDYIILSSYDYGPSYSKEALRDFPSGTLAMLQFYKEAEEDAEWVKVFESNLKDIPGPTIKIIKIRK